MASPQKRAAAPFEVENPAAAFHKLEQFARKVLAVPKKKIDAKLASEKSAKKRPKVNRPRRSEASA
jgi:hypothetical protein